MEFFQELEQPGLDVEHLKNILTIAALPVLCSSIDTVLLEKGNKGEIYCIWGQFNIRREIIRYGVRFTLLNCPHALAWTITFNELSEKIVIHCTIDKTEQDKEFIDSIYQFVDDWSYGLNKVLQQV